MKQPKLIRKYVNRRLYDTTQSRYVNLDELRELIIAGDNIQVLEQATKEDITTTILLQILEETQRTASQLLKPEFLANVIRLSHGHPDPDLSKRLTSAIGGTEIANARLEKVAREKVVPGLS
jgi:polyhydroxyalkanoate synthesis repressor PhaR